MTTWVYRRPVTATRFLAVLMVVAGAVLIVAPTLAYDPGPAPDTFEAIERRIWWGGLLGLGAAVLAYRPATWPIALGWLVFWVVSGFLVARLVGLVLDGADDLRQWGWVAAETALVAAASWFVGYWRRRSPSNASSDSAV